jgi:hypothetical protein
MTDTMNPLSISDKTVTIKKVSKPAVQSKPKPKKAVLKTVRLLDFHIYDEKPEKEESSGDEDEDEDAPPKPYEKKIDESQFVIQMFGLNEAGETFSLFVKDFQPFFFIKVGNSWTQSAVNSLLAEIKQKVGKYYENSIISAKLVEYNKLYGFSGGKLDQFAHFTFKNTSTSK